MAIGERTAVDVPAQEEWRPSLLCLPSLVFRSLDADWDRTRWEQLPADGNRYEVIAGVLYMSTAPSFFHQWIIRKLFLTINRQIDEPGIGLTMWSPIGLFMPGCDPAQPDVLVILAENVRPDTIHDGQIHTVPALLVEILSPSHPSLDTRVKREAYARAGVPEYWIIRPKTRDLLIYTRPDADLADFAQALHVGPDDELISPTLPIRASLAEWFAGAPDTTL